MDETELRRALAETLENYQRCGLKHVFSDPLQLAVAQQAIGNWRQGVTAGGSVQSPCEEAAVTGTGSSNLSAHSLDDAQRIKVLEELDAEVKACRLCNQICQHRQQTVFGTGPLRPTVCFIGEAPGADEDRMGQPFVGRAGQLLTRIIAAMQLRRDEVYILNSLKCRPPDNRTPTDQEVANCRPYMQRQLETLQPRYIVCLGSVAVRSLLNQPTTIGKLRGRFYDYEGAKVVVTYHPAYLLRNEDAKRLVWEDMQMLMREMGIAVPQKPTSAS